MKKTKHSVLVRPGYVTLDGVDRPILASSHKPPPLLLSAMQSHRGDKGLLIDLIHTDTLIHRGRDMTYRPREWIQEALVRHKKSGWMP